MKNPFTINRIKTFASEARQEFRHINWPTRAELIYLTAVVIGLSLALAVFLGFFDYAFVYLLRTVVLPS